MNLMDVGEFHERSFYAGLRLDYRLRLWAPTSASRAVSEVADLLVEYIWF